jgi:hypothetical protein
MSSELEETCEKAGVAEFVVQYVGLVLEGNSA